MNEFTQEEIEQFEQELEDTNIVAILLQQTAYLDAILRELQGPTDTSQEPQFRCESCGTLHEKNGLERHLQQEHNAPKGIDPMDMFERVER